MGVKATNMPANHVARPTGFQVDPKVMTGAKRAQDAAFIELCGKQGVKPTKRQGRAYNAGRGRWAS